MYSTHKTFQLKGIFQNCVINIFNEVIKLQRSYELTLIVTVEMAKIQSETVPRISFWGGYIPEGLRGMES